MSNNIKYFDIENERADPATKEALRYRTVLHEGVQQLQTRPVCTALAEQLCSRVNGQKMSVRKVPEVALANDASRKIIYTPPEGETLLREKLANWEQYIHNDTEIDPLIRMIVAHYQFEAIHPFTDGNGRTGRLINNLFLIEQGLLSLPILYLSRYIILNKADYYQLLQAVTKESGLGNLVDLYAKGRRRNIHLDSSKN